MLINVVHPLAAVLAVGTLKARLLSALVLDVLHQALLVSEATRAVRTWEVLRFAARRSACIPLTLARVTRGSTAAAGEIIGLFLGEELDSYGAGNYFVVHDGSESCFLEGGYGLEALVRGHGFDVLEAAFPICKHKGDGWHG